MSTQKSEVDVIVNRCKHFTGYGVAEQDKCCKAGVNYRELVGGEKMGWVLRAPCHGNHDTEITCGRREFPTREEAEDEVLAMRKRNDQTMLAISRCVHDSEEQGFAIGDESGDIVGKIECPACGNVLRYSRSSYNGHVWGKCETEDCLQWIQ